MNRLKKIALTAFIVLLAACENEESKPIPTKEMVPQFEVQTNENGISQISTVLLRDFFTVIDLVGGDQIVVTGGSAKAVVGSKAELNTGNAVNTAFQFDFQRPTQVDAPDSKGTLPPPMTLTAPVANTSYSAQNDSITVRWTDIASADSMSARIDATCRTFTGVKPLDRSDSTAINADIGIASISLSELANKLDANCSVYDGVFTLSRSRDGTLDSAYGPTDDCKRTPNCFSPAYYLVLRQVRAVPIVITNNPS